jgi:hypothetical protein
LAGAKPDASGRLTRRAGVYVSPALLHRALLILDGLSREALRRDYGVQAREKNGSGVVIVVRGHRYELGIEELVDRVPLTDDEVRRWERDNEWRIRWNPDTQPPATKPVANGRLSINLPQRWRGARWRWTEGPRGPLEGKLGAVLAEIERRAGEDDARAEEWSRCEEQRRRAEPERLEQQRRAQIEHERIERLTAERLAWQAAAATRRYVAALRVATADLPADTQARIAAWCDWAEQWAARSDPTANPDLVTGLEPPPGPQQPWR